MMSGKDLEIIFNQLWDKLEILKNTYNDRLSSEAAMACYKRMKKQFLVDIEQKKV